MSENLGRWLVNRGNELFAPLRRGVDYKRVGWWAHEPSQCSYCPKQAIGCAEHRGKLVWVCRGHYQVALQMLFGR